MEQIRGLVFYRHYFNEFFDRQSGKVKEKIDYVLFLVTHADRIPEKFLKYIEGQKGLYEVRIECGNISFVFSVALTGGEGRFQYIPYLQAQSFVSGSSRGNGSRRENSTHLRLPIATHKQMADDFENQFYNSLLEMITIEYH